MKFLAHFLCLFATLRGVHLAVKNRFIDDYWQRSVKLGSFEKAWEAIGHEGVYYLMLGTTHPPYDCVFINVTEAFPKCAIHYDVTMYNASIPFNETYKGAALIHGDVRGVEGTIEWFRNDDIKDKAAAVNVPGLVAVISARESAYELGLIPDCTGHKSHRPQSSEGPARRTVTHSSSGSADGTLCERLHAIVTGSVRRRQTQVLYTEKDNRCFVLYYTDTGDYELWVHKDETDFLPRCCEFAFTFVTDGLETYYNFNKAVCKTL
uniref:Putative salivary lipocalin n=1 Tax=Ixodes ricinus TaxID=34613 RepID=A0A147BGT7_IXORI